ncbi:hypothetical protein [Corynebacterium endometrii]|uniref:Uncharacterized protein n=1 Tax=Corynebacterium endometrii TaxID=2488819 RepID=A0A4P7QFI3_9CORY|nr:hypothetical protein [Corynebacterium endometrii]QCB28293.1 hypothetical protein CENDO_05020 [Corynebacterium endometrii]
MESKQDRDAQESLAFAEGLEQSKKKAWPNPLGVIVTLFIAVSYSVISYGIDIPAWALIVYLFLLFGGIIGFLLWNQTKSVRESYRQDPNAGEQGGQWVIPVALMVPLFLRPFAEGNIIVSALIGLMIIAFFYWVWKRNPDWL